MLLDGGEKLTFFFVFFFLSIDRCRRLLFKLVPRIPQGYRPSRPADTPDDLWSLIQRCWQHDPALRPDFLTIANQVYQMVLARSSLAGAT